MVYFEILVLADDIYLVISQYRMQLGVKPENLGWGSGSTKFISEDKNKNDDNE